MVKHQKRAGQGGDSGRQHEHPQLVFLRVVTLEQGALLVLANGDDDVAEGRARDAQQHVKHGKTDEAHQRQIDRRVLEVERADRRPHDAAQTRLAAGKRGPAKRDGEGQRRQGQRQQREINAAPAQDQKADDCRQRRDEGQRKQQRQNDLTGEPVFLRQRRRIRAEAEPGTVAKGGEAGVTHQQVKPHRRNGKNHDVSGRGQRQANGLQCKRQRNQRQRGYPQRPVFFAGQHIAHHSNLSMRSPSSPRGRNSNTASISTYIDASPAAA